MVEKIKKNGFLFMLVLVIAVTALYFCNRKQGFFLDEIYSYGLANSQYAPFIKYLFEDDITEKILTQDVIMNYITTSGEDRFDYTSVYYNQTQDVLPPLFYFFLHSVSSLFPYTFSKWFGLGLNLLYFALTLFMLYKIAYKLFSDKTNAYIAVVLYGLSSVGISTMVYIRMYMLLALISVLLAYLVLCALQGGNTKVLYPLIGVTIFAGLMTHYYYVFYAFFLCATYDFYLLFKRKLKEFLGFSCWAIGGVGCMYLAFPACMGQLLNHPRTGAPLVENLLDVNQYTSGLYILTGSTVKNAIVAVTVGVIAVLLLMIMRVNVRTVGKHYNTFFFILIAPAFVTFGVIAILVNRKVPRYVYCVIPLMIIAVCYALQLFFDEKKINKKKKKIITLAVIGLSLVMMIPVSPDYLYESHQRTNDFMEENNGYPCIYFTENSNPSLTSDLMQLRYFEEVFVTDDVESVKLQEYLDKFENREKLIVYVSTYTMAAEKDKILEKICGQYGYKEYEKICKGTFSIAYCLLK